MDRERALQFVAEIGRISPAEFDEFRAGADPAARRQMADPAWWEVAAPLVAEAFDPLLDSYGVEAQSATEMRNVRVHSASEMRWDDLVADLLVGAIVHLEGAGEPGAQLWALRARRWLLWWRRDVERHRTAAAALGVPWAPALAYPGHELPIPLCTSAADLATMVADVESGAVDLGREPLSWVSVVRMRIAGALGRHVLPVNWGYAERWAARPWWWPWESTTMEERVAWTDEGDPIPVAVVVPADFDPATMPDRFQFAAQWTPGEPLVLEGDAVLDCWSGRLGRWVVTPGVGNVWVRWRRGHPVLPVVSVERAPLPVEPERPLASVVPIREAGAPTLDTEAVEGPVAKIPDDGDTRTLAMRNWAGLARDSHAALGRMLDDTLGKGNW